MVRTLNRDLSFTYLVADTAGRVVGRISSGWPLRAGQGVRLSDGADERVWKVDGVLGVCATARPSEAVPGERDASPDST